MESGGEVLRTLTYFMAFMMAVEVHSSWKDSSRLRVILGGVTASHWFRAVWALAAVATSATAMSLAFPDVLKWGWLQEIGGGSGSLVTGPTAGTSHDTGLVLVLRYVLLVLLAAAMPTLVSYEEKIFRRRAALRSTASNAGWCLLFGLSHMVVGVPFHIALALGLFGGILTYWNIQAYKRSSDLDAATMEGTRVHLAYNYIVLAMILIASIFVDVVRAVSA